MLIEVHGERFDVSTRLGPGGESLCDFTWLNGPDGSSYGFSIGSTAPLPGGFPLADLEEHAGAFVRSFFSPDGIGPADFPEFVASRRRADLADPDG